METIGSLLLYLVAALAYWYGFVVPYATWRKWGTMSIKVQGNVALIRSPGGAIASSVPVWEMVAAYLVNTFAYPDGVRMTVTFVFAVRLVVFVPWFVRKCHYWVRGLEVDELCMDRRCNGEMNGQSEATLHLRRCGAFSVITLPGLLPGMFLIVALRQLFGIEITWWMEGLATVPWLFLLGKHLHIESERFTILVDNWMIWTETPGRLISGLLFKSFPSVIEAAHGDHE